RGDEVPAVAARADDGVAGHVGQGVVVVGVVDAVGGAVLVGQVGGTGAGDHGDALLLRPDLLHGQGAGRIEQAGDHVHLAGVEPFPGLGGGDVRLVLVVDAD